MQDELISKQAVIEQTYLWSKDEFLRDTTPFDYLRKRINSLPSVTSQSNCEDIVKAFQLGLAFGFGEKHDEMDKIIEEVKKAATPQQKIGRWIMPRQDDGMSDPIYYQARCSECNFDLDPQTWHQELHQYGADKFCPKCGTKMQEVEE